MIGFGPHALGFLGAVGEQQQLVATHSIPAETARLFGLNGTPGWWRHLWVAAFVVVLAYALWRTARGSDWRVAAGWTTIALLVLDRLAAAVVRGLAAAASRRLR